MGYLSFSSCSGPPTHHRRARRCGIRCLAESILTRWSFRGRRNWRARNSLSPFPGKEASSCTLFLSPSGFISVVLANLYPSIEVPTIPESPETPFPLAPGIVSFAWPIDTATFKISRSLGLTDLQKKACGFVRLYTYFQTPNPNLPPYTGAHPFQVLIFIPMAQSPWAERYAWLKASNRFESHGQWVSVTGPVVGVLNPD